MDSIDFCSLQRRITSLKMLLLYGADTNLMVDNKYLPLIALASRSMDIFETLIPLSSVGALSATLNRFWTNSFYLPHPNFTEVEKEQIVKKLVKAGATLQH